MDTPESVVRMQSKDLPLAGRFNSSGRIQKLIAPAREMMESIKTLKRLLDFMSRASWLTGLETVRSLKPQFLEYWQELRKLTEEKIRAMNLPKEARSCQRFRAPDNIAVNPKAETRGACTSRDPPQLFVPIPNKTELGGCARSDSLVRLLTF